MKSIEYFETEFGRMPFRDWLIGLEMAFQRKILAYVVRAAQGAAKKNIRVLGDGVFEVKVDAGPGFRVYFGEVENRMVLLLLGGDKSTQFRDIRKAKEYWRSFCVSKSFF